MANAPRRVGRSTDDRAAASSVSVPPPTDDFTRGFCAGWANRAEYARRAGLTFDDGIAIGWELAHRDMRNAIAAACHGIPADAATVIRRLVSTWDQEN